MQFPRAVLAVCVLGLSSSAEAWWYFGTHELEFKVDRTEGDLTMAEGYVEEVRVHKCGGGYDTYTIQEDVDLLVGKTISIDEGDFCGASVDWTGVVEVEKSGSWLVEYSESHTSVTFTTADGGSSALLPMEVITGSHSGAVPHLIITVE